MTAASLHGEDSSLASQCLAFCQALASQGKAFSFSLKIDSTFSFALDTRKAKLRFLCQRLWQGRRWAPLQRGGMPEEGLSFWRRSRAPVYSWMSPPADLPLSSWSLLRSLTQVQLGKQSNPINHRHLNSMGGLSFVTNAQMVAWTLIVLIPTSAPVIVGSTTTTGSTLVMILCGLFGKQMALAATSCIALAPARLLLDVPVVRCGDLKRLCRLENPKGLFWQINDWLIDHWAYIIEDTLSTTKMQYIFHKLVGVCVK